MVFGLILIQRRWVYDRIDHKAAGTSHNTRGDRALALMADRPVDHIVQLSGVPAVRDSRLCAGKGDEA